MHTNLVSKLPNRSRPISVMVVDDSAVVRGLLARMLGEDPSIEVAATASNGKIAVNELSKRRLDVVLLDIEMPVMDGMAALVALLAIQPELKIIMVSTLTRRNAEISLQALQRGACDYIAKPEGGLASAKAFQQELIEKIKALKAVDEPGSTAARRISSITAPAARRPTHGSVDLLAIGASTGGPPALLKLMEALRGSVAQPILITQHMPATFTALLAEQLARVADRPCTEGRDGEVVRPGHCYIAPGGYHMVVERHGLEVITRLNQDPPENFCRPAVDPMLRSAARTYGPGVLAVILTGMGADGAEGCRAVANAGGRFIAQDEATSVVWGMPAAAAATGLAEAVLPLNGIAPWICRVTGPAQ